MRLHGSTGLYEHPNSFAGMALGTLPFILYLFPIANKWIKALLLLQLIFALNIILYTGSRTGYIGFIAVLLVFIARSKRKIEILIILSIGILLAAQFAPEQYRDRFVSIFQISTETEGTSISTEFGKTSKVIEGGQGSVSARIQIFKDSLDIFLSHPLGVGVSAFPIN